MNNLEEVNRSKGQAPKNTTKNRRKNAAKNIWIKRAKSGLMTVGALLVINNGITQYEAKSHTPLDIAVNHPDSTWVDDVVEQSIEQNSISRFDQFLKGTLDLSTVTKSEVDYFAVMCSKYEFLYRNGIEITDENIAYTTVKVTSEGSNGCTGYIWFDDGETKLDEYFGTTKIGKQSNVYSITASFLTSKESSKDVNNLLKAINLDSLKNTKSKGR